jgi:hypothetical protein
MTGDNKVTISLTDAQVAHVARANSRSDAGVRSLFASLADLKAISGAIEAARADVHYSRSTLRALLVLAAFPDDGTTRALAEVARELDYSPSTTHRYVMTWLAAGLLEQDPSSRRYGRPVLPGDQKRPRQRRKK